MKVLFCEMFCQHSACFEQLVGSYIIPFLQALKETNVITSFTYKFHSQNMKLQVHWLRAPDSFFSNSEQG
jgi:hypothetical protein